jgi:hypothetical protein
MVVVCRKSLYYNWSILKVTIWQIKSMFFSEFDNKHIHIRNNQINYRSHFFSTEIRQCIYFPYKHLSNCVTNTSIGPNSKDSLKQVVHNDHWRENVTCVHHVSNDLLSKFKRDVRKFPFTQPFLNLLTITEPVSTYKIV